MSEWVVVRGRTLALVRGDITRTPVDRPVHAVGPVWRGDGAGEAAKPGVHVGT